MAEPKPPATRGAAIAAYCRQCIHDPAASGTWREQVATCTAANCPLWGFRPLPANAPAWIKLRDPAALPANWHAMHHDEAVRLLRGQHTTTPEPAQ